jgi:hypothetical protein
MKINDKIKNLLSEDENIPAWYSYEYFPPKTYAGKYLTNFIKFYFNYRRRKFIR